MIFYQVNIVEASDVIDYSKPIYEGRRTSEFEEAFEELAALIKERTDRDIKPRKPGYMSITARGYHYQIWTSNVPPIEQSMF